MGGTKAGVRDWDQVIIGGDGDGGSCGVGLETVPIWRRTPKGNWRKVGSINKTIALNVVLIKGRCSRTFLPAFFGLF